ncbi:MAG: MFS transporter [Acidimicrobiia bacterium]
MSRIGGPRRRATALVALLVLGMVASTYQQGALAVLSRFILDEFDMNKVQLGLMFSVSSLVGAAAAPTIGGFADRGIRPALQGLFIFALGGTLLAALAPGYSFLLIATVLGGMAIGAANPVTNRVVVERISIQRRGAAIGLKQAGPPLSTFLAGLVLPGLALVVGWRLAISIGAILPILGLIGTRALLPAEPQGWSRSASKPPPLERGVRASVSWLNGIGFGIAICNGAVLAFVPLYAQERVGLTATGAGFVASTMGLCAVLGRIGWGTMGHRFKRPSTALLIISVVSVVGVLAIGASAALGPLPLWLGAMIAGGSSQAWHAVAWLVVIDRVGTGGVGKASGVMQVGSSVGFAVGPLLIGTLIDNTGDYWFAWGALAVIYGAVTVATYVFRQTAPRRRAAVEA